jgi:hypothetical protein
MRRKLADLTGLPETELRGLLRQAGSPDARPRAGSASYDDRVARRPAAQAMPGQRRAPSLVRELLQGLLLQPELARTVALPQPEDGTAEGVALSALVAFCAESECTLTTAGIMQHFAGTFHDRILAQVLATAEDQGITAEQATEHLKEGVGRYWQQAQRAGRPVAEAAGPDTAARTTPEETERLRQLDMVRRAPPGGGPPATRGNGS